ncbi:SLOG domain-containing protein [Mesorhizobium sp. 113-3-3]|uniref:SLOG domain-containing protein n=1 Tax=Mesorhizobium sp. 113-3-3 TaxID=2744516 RepID=UPI00192830F6
MFRQRQPHEKVTPATSIGGACLDVAAKLDKAIRLRDQRDFVALFHGHLGISVRRSGSGDLRT